MDIFKICVDRQKRIDKVVNKLNNTDINIKNLLIKDRIINPSHYIVMLGETSSGKSALINGIFNNKILVESVKPTTGVVTEVIIDHNSEEKLLAIKNDTMIENIEESDFENLTVKPSKDLIRLRYIGESKNSKYDGMRIFDTPGYGSLVEKHEEVLKEFIPESDFIIYVVSYRTGIGEVDFQFLKYVGEIINSNVEVVLAINMCPENISEDNKRIAEIKKSVCECIHKDTKTFLIESSSEKKPVTDQLWDYIYEKVSAPKKIEELSETLKNYQDYLLSECDIKISSKIAEIQCEKESVVEKVNIIKEFVDRKKDIIDIIEDGFVKIKLKAIRFLGKSDIKIKENITNYIYDESKWSMKEETFALMQHYYVPKLTNEETENLNTYIEDEIIALDRKIDEFIKEEIIKLKKSIKMNTPSYSEVIGNIIEKHRGDIIKKATGDMFRKVCKNDSNTKNLKKLSNVFETKDFGKRSDNLNHALKTIKASSLKGITESLNVFTDSIFFLYDSLTWQNKINDIVLGAIDNWANNMEIVLRKYLDELKEINKEDIECLFDEVQEEFNHNKNELDHISSEELIRLKTEIEFLLNKCILININKE